MSLKKSSVVRISPFVARAVADYRSQLRCTRKQALEDLVRIALGADRDDGARLRESAAARTAIAMRGYELDKGRA